MIATATESASKYPPIGDYAVISDCHCNALISRAGSVDWCCMPRLDDDSCFGRLLDWDMGGHCVITPADTDYVSTRRYVEDTMILETHFKTSKGEVRLFDAWRNTRDEMRLAIETQGYNAQRGIFTQTFEDGHLDGACRLH